LENRGKKSTTKVPEEEPTGRKKGRWLTRNKQEKQRVKSSLTLSMRWVLSIVAWNKRHVFPILFPENRIDGESLIARNKVTANV